MRGKGIAAFAAALLATQAGQAQVRTLQFDINNLSFESRNSLGTPAPFGGLSHTGSLVFTDVQPTTQLVGILLSTGGGPFVNQPGAPWNLSDASLTINLSNGNVTGGAFSVEVNGGGLGGGDTYTANLGAAGMVSTYVGGGFMVEGLTSAGMFTDASFASVNVADFFAAQGGSPGLTGSFLAFRIQPNAGGSGFADLDAFVTVPTPGSAACLGAAMLLVARRRRR